MNRFLSSSILRSACAVSLIAATGLATAQTARRSVTQKAQPAAPAAAARMGTPSAAGLSSTTTVGSPTGFSSQFPAGLPSPMPFPAGLPSVTTPNLSAGAPTTATAAAGMAGGTTTGTIPVIDATAVDATTTVQAPNTAVNGGPGVPAGRRTPGAGGSGYTAQQMAASFYGADSNHDGELTRAEAQRLTIQPYSFEEMDANHDGVISRFEYDDVR